MEEESYESAKKLIDLSGEEIFVESRLKEKMEQILKLPGNNECAECGQEGQCTYRYFHDIFLAFLHRFSHNAPPFVFFSNATFPFSLLSHSFAVIFVIYNIF